MKIGLQYLSLIFQSLLFVIAFISCNDDLTFPITSKDEIGFKTTVANGWEEFKSRSEERIDKFVHASVTQGDCNTYSIPIYLHTVISEYDIAEPLAEDILMSRANPTISGYETIGVSGVYAESTGISSYLMRDERIESPYKSTGRYWPNGEGNVTFYAFSPFDASGLTSSFPELTYEVPKDPLNQKDILIGKSASYNLPEDKAKTVELPLRHALTAVQFVASPSFEPGTIESMTVKNVCDFATFDFDSFEWHMNESRKSFSVKFNDPIMTGNDTINIFTQDKTLMMIPQTFNEKGNEIELEIVFYDNLDHHNKHIVKFKLSDSWQPGTKVKYCISTNPKMIERVFETNLTNIYEFKYDGTAINGSKPEFFINSYAVYADEDGEHYEELDFDEPIFPDWIAINNKSRIDIVDPITNRGVGCYKYDFTISGNTNYKDADPHGDILRNTTPLSGIRNLADGNSLSSDVSNTANCYVINAAGKYKLPLIIGNGIKNGEINSSSFKYLTDKELGVLKLIYSPITDYKGNLILDPHILNAKSASVLWQDVDNLISSVTLCDNNKWLLIEIDESNIAQGNAVIAVNDEYGDVIWSWHIWVTDFDITQSANNIQVGNFKFLCDNIGWCDGKSRIYQEKKFEYCFKQHNSTNSIVGSFIQCADTISQIGNSTYYQWGRKDPFPGMSNYDERKSIYNGSVSVHSDIKGDGYGYGYSDMIRNPNVFFSFGHHTWFYYDQGDDYNKLPYTAWNSSAFNIVDGFDQYKTSRNISTKSIYDPCPVGYKVPPNGAYYQIRDLFKWDNDIMAYTITESNNTLYFYALGYIVANTKNGTVGDLWEAGINNREHLRYWTTEISGIEAVHLCHKIGTNNVHAENSHISQGFPIKAIVDE